MNREIFRLLLIIVLVFPVGSVGLNFAKKSEKSPGSSLSTINMATWNVRILSDGSRDDKDLSQIAEILKRYDLIAVQEVRDTVVLGRLENMLSGYEYIASAPVGNTVKEI